MLSVVNWISNVCSGIAFSCYIFKNLHCRSVDASHCSIYVYENIWRMPAISSFQHIFAMIKTLNESNALSPNRDAGSKRFFGLHSFVCAAFQLVWTVITCNVLDSVWREKLGTYKPHRIPFSNERSKISSWFGCALPHTHTHTPLIALLYLHFISFRFVHFVRSSSERIPCASVLFHSHHIGLYGIMVVIVFYSFNMQFSSNL